MKRTPRPWNGSGRGLDERHDRRVYSELYMHTSVKLLVSIVVLALPIAAVKGS